jgi:hypothetical protein
MNEGIHAMVKRARPTFQRGKQWLAPRHERRPWPANAVRATTPRVMMAMDRCWLAGRAGRPAVARGEVPAGTKMVTLIQGVR